MSRAALRARVLTYNVLSPELASPSFFTSCDPEHLVKPKRLEMLKEILEHNVQKQAVLCLQELTREWAADLTAHLEARDYTLVTALYGRRFNGYMGVALAYPRARYAAEKIDFTKLGDLVAMPKRAPKPEGVVANALALVRSGWSAVRAFFPAAPAPPFDPWAQAERRENVLVSARLRCRDTGRSFCVSTYHMPCLFGSAEKVQVMNIHAALAAERAEAFADDAPFVLAGDFNIQPDSSPYEMLTCGSLPADHPEMPPAREGVGLEWAPARAVALRSAYSAAGREPELTNLAINKFSPTPFVGTLDYLFLSSEWSVSGVRELPSRASLGVPSLPSASEPSDHLMLYADLELHG